MSDTTTALKAELAELDRQHAEIRARLAPLRAKREEFNLKAIKAQEEANKLTAEMQKIYEETGFFDLARRRGRVADALMTLK